MALLHDIECVKCTLTYCCMDIIAEYKRNIMNIRLFLRALTGVMSVKPSFGIAVLNDPSLVPYN